MPASDHFSAAAPASEESFAALADHELISDLRDKFEPSIVDQNLRLPANELGKVLRMLHLSCDGSHAQKVARLLMRVKYG